MKAGWCGAPRDIMGCCTRWMAASTADAYRFVWLRFLASLVCGHPQDAGDLSLNVFVPFLLWFPARHWSYPYALGIQCCSTILGQISVNFLLLFLVVCYCYRVSTEGRRWLQSCLYELLPQGQRCGKSCSSVSSCRQRTEAVMKSSLQTKHL